MAPHPIADLPKHAKLISTIWSYRWKRLPDGTLLEHKARMCINGKQQELGRDYWETYTPVASWATICLMLILSTILNLKSCQIDYTQAFPQAKLDDPVFIRVPQGWYIKDETLHQHDDPRFNDTAYFACLKRNLYGIKQAAHNWFNHLRNGPIRLSFNQSTTDCCLFL
jgi:hypothetical protein